MMDYHHTKFGLIWIKESKVTEGGGIRLPQVENVLNRSGEIGLNLGPLVYKRVRYQSSYPFGLKFEVN